MSHIISTKSHFRAFKPKKVREIAVSIRKIKIEHSTKGRTKVLNQVFTNAAKQAGRSKGPRSIMMLTGNPGVGKTSFFRMMSEITGVPIEVAEVPQMVAEHVINLPLISFVAGKQQGGTVDIENAQSFLYKRMRRLDKQKLTDAQLLEYYNQKMSNAAKAVFKSYGGSSTRIPVRIQEFRENYNAILFVDEYLRKTSPQIRNILRELINNKLGQHELHKKWYVVFAANKKDSGQEESLPANTTLLDVDLPPPSFGDWATFNATKIEKMNVSPEIKKHIDAVFANILSMANKNLKDEDGNPLVPAEDLPVLIEGENDFSLTPRRLTHAYMFLAANLPVNNPEEAKQLLLYFENLTHHYNPEEAGHSKLPNELRDAMLTEVLSCIKQVGVAPNGDKAGLEKVTINDRVEMKTWANILAQQIRARKKSKGEYDYMTTLSGPPGVGKTSEMRTVIEHLGMDFIEVSATGLMTDDLIGLPITEKLQEEDYADQEGISGADASYKTAVRFSKSSFQDLIMRHYDYIVKQRLAARAEGDRTGNKVDYLYPQDEDYDGRYNVVLFIDEFNRVANVNAFNALRRVVLEKTFSNGEKLPEDIMITAAINPIDSGSSSSVIELTGHMADVMDFVPVYADWGKTKSYLEGFNVNLKYVYDQNQIQNAARAMVFELANTLKVKSDVYKEIPDESNEFYWMPTNSDTGGDFVAFRLNPRDYETLYTELVAAINSTLLSYGVGLDENGERVNTIDSTISFGDPGGGEEANRYTVMQKVHEGLQAAAGDVINSVLAGISIRYGYSEFDIFSLNKDFEARFNFSFDETKPELLHVLTHFKISESQKAVQMYTLKSIVDNYSEGHSQDDGWDEIILSVAKSESSALDGSSLEGLGTEKFYILRDLNNKPLVTSLGNPIKVNEQVFAVFHTAQAYHLLEQYLTEQGVYQGALSALITAATAAYSHAWEQVKDWINSGPEVWQNHEDEVYSLFIAAILSQRLKQSGIDNITAKLIEKKYPVVHSFDIELWNKLNALAA